MIGAAGITVNCHFSLIHKIYFQLFSGPVSTVLQFTFSGYNTVVKDNDKEVGTFDLVYNQVLAVS